MLSLTCEFGNVAFHLAWSPGASQFLGAVANSCGVAAGVSPAVEPGILPGGRSSRIPHSRREFQRIRRGPERSRKFAKLSRQDFGALADGTPFDRIEELL